MDGLKPGQRKVMFVCFNRKGMDKKEVKVAQLAGSVAEKSAYHHGEVSLMETTIKLAQDYVGSNNINLQILMRERIPKRLNHDLSFSFSQVILISCVCNENKTHFYCFTLLALG